MPELEILNIRGEEYILIKDLHNEGNLVCKVAELWELVGQKEPVDLSQMNLFSEEWDRIFDLQRISMHPALPYLVTVGSTYLDYVRSADCQISSFVKELHIGVHTVGPDMCLDEKLDVLDKVRIDGRVKALAVFQLTPSPSIKPLQQSEDTRFLIVFGGSVPSSAGFRGQAIIKLHENPCEMDRCPMPMNPKISMSLTELRVLHMIALQTDELLLVDGIEELLGEYGEIREIKGRPVTFSRASPPDPYERLCDWKENTRPRFRNGIPKEYRESIKQHLLLVALPDQILLCNPLTFQRLAVMSGISIEDYFNRPVEYIKELSLLSVVREDQKETMFVRLTTLRDGTVGLRLEAQVKMPASFTVAVSPRLKVETPHRRAGKDSEQYILFDGLDTRQTRIFHPPPNVNNDNEFILLGWVGNRNVSMSIRKR